MSKETTNEDLLKAIGHLDLKVSDLRGDVCGHLHDHDNMLRNVVDQVSALTERGRSHSLKAQSISQENLETAAALAQEIEARKVVEVKVDKVDEKVDKLDASNVVQLAILQRLDKVAANPTVKMLVYAIGIVIGGWLAGKGLK
jgi:hypothetical protein